MFSGHPGQHKIINVLFLGRLMRVLVHHGLSSPFIDFFVSFSLLGESFHILVIVGLVHELIEGCFGLVLFEEGLSFFGVLVTLREQ